MGFLVILKNINTEYKTYYFYNFLCKKFKMELNILDLVGWSATAIVICSFLINNMLWLRTVNLVGALLWLAYGILDLSYSIIFLNVVIVSIQGFKIVGLIRKTGN